MNSGSTHIHYYIISSTTYVHAYVLCDVKCYGKKEVYVLCVVRVTV